MAATPALQILYSESTLLDVRVHSAFLCNVTALNLPDRLRGNAWPLSTVRSVDKKSNQRLRMSKKSATMQWIGSPIAKALV